MSYNTRYPKPWQIGKVELDPPSSTPNTPRLSTIEIVDANENVICTLRTYVQYVGREIIDAINECDRIWNAKKIQHCADCLYYVKDVLTSNHICKYPLGCVNKNLFERKEC